MKSFFSLLQVVLCLLSLPVLANPIKTVGTAVVNKGMHTAEFRTGYGSDDKSPANDGRFQMRQQYDYGVTDMLGLRLTLIQDDRGVHDLEYDTTMFDARLQFFEKAQHGFDGGLRLTYQLRDGDKKPDIAETRWINHFYFGQGYEFRHHVILQHQAGEDSRHGLMPELRWQVTAPTVGRHRAGLEMFNEFRNLRDNHDFRDQYHDAGPVFTGPLFAALRYQAGYRHGISDASPDHAFKFFVGYDF